MKRLSRDLKYCQDCREAGTKEFIKEPNTGDFDLVNKHEGQVIKSIEKSDLERVQVSNELGQHKSKCKYIPCKTLMQQVRRLLDDLAEVNEMVEICCYCKRSNISGKCKRCEYIFNNFSTPKVKHYEDQQKRFALWLHKVKHFLQTVLDGQTICMHNCKDSSAKELENLLQDLKKPLSMREPEIDPFLSVHNKVTSIATLSESKDMLNELLRKIKTNSVVDNLTTDKNMNISTAESVVGLEKTKPSKPFAHEEPKQKIAETLSGVKDHDDHPKLTKPILAYNAKTIKDEKNKVEGKSLAVKENAPPKDKKTKSILDIQKGKNSPKKSNSLKEPKTLLESKTPENSNQKRISEDMMNALIRGSRKENEERQNKNKIRGSEKENGERQDKNKIRGREKENGERQDKNKNIRGSGKENFKLSKFAESLGLKLNVKQSDIDETSVSVLECGDDRLLAPLEMIKCENIVPFDPHYRDEEPVKIKTLLFNVALVFPDSSIEGAIPQVAPNTSLSLKENKNKEIKNPDPLKGIIKYELSNKEFIQKGWTQLPTEKIMRKMNIYKLIPAKPQYDWFKRHQNRKIMFYESGEKLADFNDEGGGKWYYRNGRVALEYTSATESNASQRYVVFSSGEEIDNEKFIPATVLACFDFLGNGVVYDQYGNTRLEYNQSEGMMVDSKIGFRRWKWHTLNEPPVLQTVFIDTYVKHHDSCLENALKNQKDGKLPVEIMRSENNEMLAIELENFVKEKANKMLKMFKPSQFRVKVLKINDQFSIRIMDQQNIYILFRDGLVSLKLNLGLTLVSNEIVANETTEISQVGTPYDRNPPISESIADIQEILRNARKIGKRRQAKLANLMNL